MRKLLIILGILALIVGVAAWRLPAGLLLEPVQSRLPEVDWSDTEGTAWNGRIEGFAWKGLQLGTVAWEFVGLEGLDSRMTRWNVHGHSPQYDLRAQVVLTPDGDVSEVFDLRGYAPASWIDITDRLPLIYLEGVIRFDIENLVLENGLPLNGEGNVSVVRQYSRAHFGSNGTFSVSSSPRAASARTSYTCRLPPSGIVATSGSSAALRRQRNSTSPAT